MANDDDPPKQGDLLETATPDPGNYRAMSVPFSSKEACEAALQAFSNDLAELRKKHKMQDVHFCIQTNYVDDGDEATVLLSYHLGHALNSETMLAHALGRAQAERRALVERLLAGAKTKRRK